MGQSCFNFRLLFFLILAEELQDHAKGDRSVYQLKKALKKLLS